MTENGEKVWLQTIVYPFYYTSCYGRGTVLHCECCCESYTNKKIDEVPYIEATAVLSEDEDTIAVFAVNRSLENEREFDLTGMEGYHLTSHTVLEGDDVKAFNSSENPNNVISVQKELSGKIILSKTSWKMLVFEKD